MEHDLSPHEEANSDDIRAYVAQKYVRPARERGEAQFFVAVREVGKHFNKLHKINHVCSALRSEKFLRAHGLRLLATEGPPSGVSTTVVFTFGFAEAALPSTNSSSTRGLLALRGSAREAFAILGGGEQLLAHLRAGWGK